MSSAVPDELAGCACRYFLSTQALCAQSSMNLNRAFKSLLRLVVFAALTYGCYALALRFIYPGVFQPVAVPHTDLYLPMVIANSIFDISTPRPVGIFLDYFRGKAGLSGSIYLMLIVIFLNCSLSFLILKKLVQPINSIRSTLAWWFGYFVYAWSIFTHPHFYIFAVWDAYSQYSYFLLAVSLIWYLRFARTPLIAFGGFFLLVVFAFLAKETYVVSFLVILPLIEVGRLAAQNLVGSSDQNNQANRNKRIALLWGLVCLAFCYAFVVNNLLDSPFTSNTSFANDAYKISLSPASILSEWLRYAMDGWSRWTALAVLALVVAPLVARKTIGVAWLNLAVIAAGVAAWLPNSTLPNHHFAQYSLTGSYLFFLPIVICLSWLGAKQVIIGLRSFFVTALIVMTFLVLPFANGPIYSNIENDFYLSQIRRQKNLIEVIQNIATESKVNTQRNAKKFLLTGISSPFNPFTYPVAFQSMFRGKSVSLDVVAYGDDEYVTKKSVDDAVELRRIHASNVVDTSQYAEIYTVGLDGSSVLTGKTDWQNIEAAMPAGIEEKDIILYPEVGQALRAKTARSDGVSYLNCGLALQKYAADEKALMCLERSMELIPSNPYPYFFYALSEERLGNMPGAIGAMKMAVSAQDASGGNPLFLSELARLEKKPK